MCDFVVQKVYFCIVLLFIFDIQAESLQHQYPINDNAVCYNVHNVTIQDSQIHGDINFEGISGLLEENSNTEKNNENKHQVNIYCINQYAITIVNSVIDGNVVVDGICRILEVQENFKKS